MPIALSYDVKVTYWFCVVNKQLYFIKIIKYNWWQRKSCRVTVIFKFNRFKNIENDEGQLKGSTNIMKTIYLKEEEEQTLSEIKNT